MRQARVKSTDYDRPPALTPELAEQRCIEESFKLAESQLRAGTASPSVITHFLKMGTERARLEREKLAKETELLSTKNTAIKNAETSAETYAEAMKAFKTYAGIDDGESGWDD